MKKSASQPAQRGPSKAGFPPADAQPISMSVRSTRIQRFQGHDTLVAAEDPAVYIASYSRTLSGVIGIISDDSQLPNGPGVLVHTIGRRAVRYLTAHGYTPESQHAIARAYTDFPGEEGFVAFLCGKGMARSEVNYLWDYISDRA